MNDRVRNSVSRLLASVAVSLALMIAGSARAQDDRRIEVPSVGPGDVAADIHRSEREASRKVGELLYRRGAFAQASAELEAAVSADPHDRRALLFAGLAELRQNDPAKAAALWRRFEAETRDEALAREIGRARTILLREASERAAKQAIARERALSAMPGDRRAVAVGTFRNAGSDRYGHLGKALSAMLIDNLSALTGVNVLERGQVEALEEEAKLTNAGLVGKGTAVRAGHLLRAGRVTAGSHADSRAEPTRLRVDALLVDVESDAMIAEEGSEKLASRFYELVPSVATRFAEALGQPLGAMPPSTRARLTQQHTQSVRAAVAFGNALDALDRHDVAAAHLACEEMHRWDPRFRLAVGWCARLPKSWMSVEAVVAAVEPVAFALAGSDEGQRVTWEDPATVGSLLPNDPADKDVGSLALVDESPGQDPGCAGTDSLCLYTNRSTSQRPNPLVVATGALPAGVVAIGPLDSFYLILFDGDPGTINPLDGYLGISGADSSRALLGVVFADQGNFSRTGGNQPLIGTASGLSSLKIMNVLR
jgi:TolB-like protein